MNTKQTLNFIVYPTVALAMMCSATANAASHFYAGGAISTCTSTCDVFASLSGPPDGSTLAGEVAINAGPNSPFSAEDIGAFSFLITNPAAPLEPYDGTNIQTANPLPLDPSFAIIEQSTSTGFHTGGITDDAGQLYTGIILFRFTEPPLSSNDAWMIFDVGTGTAQLCLFFDLIGCIPGATEIAVFKGGCFSQTDAWDCDSDGVANTVDNCIRDANSSQLDTDGDGIGNRCDADLNGDCVVNFVDLGIFKSVYLTAAADADFDGDGFVSAVDLGILKSLFFRQPGPSALPSACP